MIDYIKGSLTRLTPTFVTVETYGVGYFVNISLTTFSKLENKSEIKILIHEIIREDTHQLYGFADSLEREIFRHLISVTGVGANTARMMLSSLNPVEIEQAIIGSDVNILKSIKGIGLKTAQRIIVDLKEKLGKQAGSGEIFAFSDNTNREEALSALVMLGFAKSAVSKVLDKIVREQKNLTVEEMIKRALKNL
ncbi:MAG: Holliday junction DNA helicase RuvA [Bacteroidetes bacterium GWE2_41_25]|nr:MAG: Holliday junction DNA helicase RuvA [Bacteroidetes bacterium GWA2_40_15]OFX87457.1 MAG: Holliday junction DNA helicase RuvA [Bacteroidetes bacterium GWC2_40_22]OFY00910.1 MAG: Holliday junction DNA helicase RuvA [Bacteroidetes bacterium GWE2_41_25]OFY60830.1 MAG: Holliday junction DNA helicase RuvA [Bacteroidetes bacterium GWF2_41_9]HAM09545.1 Holliday junction branch migration protein RuvA [Bacteroidales bacterium]